MTGGPIEGATVAVHGLGPIGLFAVNAAKAMGAAEVIAVDWDNRFRMDLAEQLGADLVLGKDHDVVAEILAATDGQGVDNACEFSGAQAALANAIRSTRMGGFVNVLSVYGTSMPEVPMNEVVFRYLHLKGINGRKMWGTWDRMYALLEAGAIDVERIVTHPPRGRIQTRHGPGWTWRLRQSCLDVRRRFGQTVKRQGPQPQAWETPVRTSIRASSSSALQSVGADGSPCSLAF